MNNIKLKEVVDAFNAWCETKIGRPMSNNEAAAYWETKTRLYLRNEIEFDDAQIEDVLNAPIAGLGGLSPLNYVKTGDAPSLGLRWKDVFNLMLKIGDSL